MGELPSKELPEDGVYELDSRSDSGVEVKLFWHQPTNTTYIALIEEIKNKGYAFVVDGVNAADAFEHPWAYAHSAGVLDVE